MDRKRPRLDNNDDDDDDGITLPSDFDEDRYDDDDEPGYSYYPDPDNPALEGVAGDNWNRNGEGENEDESESDDEDGVNDVGRNVEVDLKEQDVVFSRGILDEKVILEKANKDASELLKEVNIEDQRMVLKEHPERYPLYVTGTGRFYLESFAPDYAKAYDFVVTIADPVTRQKFIQEFQLNTYSLFSAVVIGKDYEYVRSNLERFLKTKEVPKYVGDFIKVTMEKNGRPRLVLRGNKYMVESYNDGIIKKLANDDVFKKSWLISKRILAREKVVKKPPAPAASAAGKTPAEAAQALQQQREQQQREQQERQMDLEKKMKKKVVIQRYYDDDDDDDEALATSTVVPSAPGHPAVPVKRKSVHGFEIDNADVEEIKRRGYELGCPLIEEYSYKEEPKFAPRPPPGKDSGDASSMLAPAPVPTCSPLKINLRSFVAIRPYQEKSLSRMFASSRARSGIIVLACGAGKTLVGITAACTIQKSCLVVCNSTVSVHQWKAEFMRWSDIDEDSIALFTSEEKKSFDTDKIRPLVIANYNILTMADENVNKASKKIRLAIENISWGLIILDEVHVLMANMFKDVIGKIKAHCKLGLTATLIREDKKIEEANFLIGPKLYEANWMDLARNGFLATVQCIEVRCKMAEDFFEKYLKTKEISTKRLLAVLNPNKMRCCHFLVQYHEARGDKIIIFADLVSVLNKCQEILGESRKCIQGKTTQSERMEFLNDFRNGRVKTLIISRVGDTSIDLPDANVIIQISSQFGSRRQEAQRLGRILRKKQGKYATDEVNAFFYTLVSQDTNEMYYTSKRQQFLIDQGYSYKVVPDLEKYNSAYNYELCFSTPKEREDLLEYALQSASEKKRSKALQDSKKGIAKRGRPAEKKPKSITSMTFTKK